MPLRTALVTTAAPAGAADTLAIGRVRSEHMDVVAAEQGGRVVELLAEVGDRVVAGQVLARLDPAAAAMRLAIARAEQDRAATAAAERGRNAVRLQHLVADGTASPAELEAAQAEARQARAAARIAAQQLSLAERERALTVLKAPAAGVVAVRSTSRSAVVPPGAPVFEIEAEGPRRISAMIPAGVADRLTQGERLVFRHNRMTGTASVVGVSARDNGAGGREVNLAIVGAAPEPGATVELVLPAAPADATARVPQSAVIEARNGARSVHVVGADRVLRTVPVKVIAFTGADAQVKGRLNPGDLVVAAGAEFLQPGMRIRPVPFVR